MLNILQTSLYVWLWSVEVPVVSTYDDICSIFCRLAQDCAESVPLG